MAHTTFHIVTLGCKVNQYESQSLREAWLDRGMTEAPFAAGAAVVVVNSCAVTQKAVADVRAHIRRLHREAPEARIVVTGCAAATVGDSLANLPGVVGLVGRKGKASLLAHADTWLPPAATAPDKAPYPPFAIRGYTRSRAVLKIQDGCSHCCTYCIVPQARGPARTRPLHESLDEAGRLLHAGFGEIVISGINLRQYGNKGHSFWDFVQALEERFAPDFAGRARFRISSLEPGQLDDHALLVLGKSRLIAPHLHLSLQSGSPVVLERMGRGHYAPQAITDWLAALQDIWPLYGLGADLISGFPGETPAEHDQTLALVQALPLTYAHVFPYSRRPGTPAATMPDQVADPQKKARAASLRAIASSRKEAFLRQQAALPRLLVALEQDKGRAIHTGVSEYYGDCEFIGPLPAGLLSGHGATLVPARPLGLARGKILVEALPKEVA